MIWIYTVCKDRAYPGSAGPGSNSGFSILVLSQTGPLTLAVERMSFVKLNMLTYGKCSDFVSLYFMGISLTNININKQEHLNDYCSAVLHLND